jgi:uncharacterized protein YndB with AHSA1/START domain
VIDIIFQINSVRRTVSTQALDAGSANSVTISRTYDAALDDIWDACTSPERIARWFLPVTGDLQAGGRYQIEGNAGGTIERCDAPRTFAATWEYGNTVSWIELRLHEESGGTRLDLEHIAPADGQQWKQFGPGALGVGWDLALLGLSLHLSKGRSASPPADETWTASADGRRFQSLSSERWGEADIAAGANPADARIAAAAVRAFYLGPETPLPGTGDAGY